jgi:hypothetical protein
MNSLERQRLLQKSKATQEQVAFDLRVRRECGAALRILFRERYGRSPTEEEEEQYPYTPEGRFAVLQAIKLAGFAVRNPRRNPDWPDGTYWQGMKVK